MITDPPKREQIMALDKEAGKGGDGVDKLYANRVAFAAITTSGGVVTWGDQSNGGDSSSVTADLVNVKYIEPSGSAFTAVVDSSLGLTVE